MLTVTSQRIQTKFGEISDIVKSREPVVITQYGRPTMMLVCYDDDMMELIRQYHAKKNNASSQRACQSIRTHR